VAASLPKPKLIVPAFVRALAAMAASIVIAGSVFGSLIISSLNEILAHSTDKEYIKQTLTSMGFGEGVISAFPTVLAFRLPPTAAVIVAENLKDMHWLVISRYEAPDLADAKEQIDKFYDIGIFTTTYPARFQSIVKEDKVDLDGHCRIVHYLIGTLRDNKDIVYTGVCACLVNGKKVLMVQFMQPSDKPFSLDLVLDIMRKASSF